MKRLTMWVLAATVLVPSTAGLAGERLREARQGRLRERLEHVLEVRRSALEFFAAKAKGDREAALAAAGKCREAWKGLPEEWRTRIEEKHPGTGERALGLAEEYDLPDGDAAPAADGGGKTVTTEGTWTKDGNTVTREGTTTGPGGKTVTREDTWTKDGNTVTREGTVTGPGGQVVEKEATWTKDGDTVTREGSTTGPGGKSASSTDTWTKDGSTVTREGATTTSGGKTWTRDDTWQKDGSTVTHDGARTGPNGGSATLKDTWTRDGKTVTHTGSATGTGQWKPNFKDDLDVFGGRPRPKPAARKPSAPARRR